MQGENTAAASSAFIATLSASLGENYVSEEAGDHLAQHFKAKKKKKKGLFGFIVAAGISAAEFAATSVWAGSGIANIAVSQSIAQLAGSAAGQLAADGHLDWVLALEAGLTAGVTADLNRLPVYGSQSLNQLAGIQTIGGQVIAGTFNSDEFARSLLAMAGRDIVSAGVSSAISGTSFDAALKQSLINDLAAVGANVIGGTCGPSTFENILTHAGLGCAAAAAGGGRRWPAVATAGRGCLAALARRS